MSKREQIYAAADRMVAQRRPVSVRLLRKELGGSGSHTDIAPILGEWRRDRNYHAALASLDMSEDLAKALASTVRALQASTGPQRRRRPRQVDDRTFDEVMEDAAELAAQFQNSVARLEELIRSPQRPTGGRPPLLQKTTTLDFWRGLIREVYKLLDEPRTAEEILRGLDPELVDLATRMTPPRGRKSDKVVFNETELKQRLKDRIKKHLYFAQVGNRYTRHPNGTQP